MSEESQIEDVQGSVAPESLAPEAPEAAPVAAAPEAAPQYQPEYSYQWNKEKHEIEDFWRPLIKDKQSEERVRDLLQKAAGIEEYKVYKQQLNEWKEPMTELQELQKLYQAGKHEDLLERIGIDEETLFNVAREKLQRRNMSPEQKQMFEEKRRVQLEKDQLLAENSRYKEQVAHETANLINYQVDMELGKPQYQSVVDKYEAANGKGSFRDFVLTRGEILSHRAGKTVPPSEVLSSILKEYSAFMPSPAETQVAHKQSVKVIPNVRGAGSSPERTQVRSLDDIRKLAQIAAGADD